MPRLATSLRLRRLLTIIPWIVAQDGPRISDVCARFDITRDELEQDLSVLFMVGLHPFTPDALVEADWDDERVWIRYADFFERPLKLTPSQALLLVAAGRGLLAVPGSDQDGPLARGLRKLADVVGVDPDATLQIDLGQAETGTVDLLRQAKELRRAVEIDYYSYGRDVRTTRVIEPARIYTDGGNWYVSAYCRSARTVRHFRVDRIVSATLLDEAADRSDQVPAADVFTPAEDDPRVVLEVGPGGRWIVEQYPVEGVEELGDGRARVSLAVAAAPWFERLLLKLGPDATVVDVPQSLLRATLETTDKLLARYERG